MKIRPTRCPKIATDAVSPPACRFQGMQIAERYGVFAPCISWVLVFCALMASMSSGGSAIAMNHPRNSGSASAEGILTHDELSFPADLIFDPPGGGFDSPISIILSTRFDDPEAVIRYTLDGRDPTESDPLVSLDRPIQLAGGGAILVKARAWSAVFGISEVHSAFYIFHVRDLIFSPPASIVVGGSVVSITCSTPDVHISYSFDPLLIETNVPVACPTGEICPPLSLKIPNPNLAWIAYTGAVSIVSNSVLSAKAEKHGYISAAASAKYELPRLPRPDFSPSKGPITNGTLVAISSSVSGAAIRFTLDGSEPTPASREYVAPLLLEENTPLRAKSFLHGYNGSYTRYTLYRSFSNSPVYQPNSGEWPQLQFSQVASLQRPVFITHAGDGTDRVFYVEEAGRIGFIGQSSTFLDITNRVGQMRGRGMVSIAFPPEYDSRSHFYVSYYDSSGGLIVSRFSAIADPLRADSASGELVLHLPNPYGTSFGGQLAFGPDGYLYIALGDPEANGGPGRRAQAPDEWYGKMLRLDVENGAKPYAIPTSNPFLTNSLFRPEIWAMGLRDPARFSFDRLTGDLILADIGQGVGEINLQESTGTGGENYGWSLVEADSALDPGVGSDLSRFTLPVATHQGPGQIVGGIRYRGPDVSRLNDTYFYGDARFGGIWGLRQDGTGWVKSLLATPTFEIDCGIHLPGQTACETRPLKITAFGEDEQGRLYIANYGATIGVQVPPDWQAVQVDVGGGLYLLEDNLLVFPLCITPESDQRLTLRWQSAPGMKYRVEFSTDLNKWKVLRGPLKGTGQALSMTNVRVPKKGHRFYRVVATPSKAKLPSVDH